MLSVCRKRKAPSSREVYEKASICRIVNTVRLSNFGGSPGTYGVLDYILPWDKDHSISSRDKFTLNKNRVVVVDENRGNQRGQCLRYFDRIGLVYKTESDVHVRQGDAIQVNNEKIRFKLVESDPLFRAGLVFWDDILQKLFPFMKDDFDEHGLPAKCIPLNWWANRGRCGYLTHIVHLGQPTANGEVFDPTNLDIRLELTVENAREAIENGVVTRKGTPARLSVTNLHHAGVVLFDWGPLPRGAHKPHIPTLAAFLAMFYFAYYSVKGTWADEDYMRKHNYNWIQGIQGVFGFLGTQKKRAQIWDKKKETLVIPPLSTQQHPLVPVATVKHLHLPSIVSLVPYETQKKRAQIWDKKKETLVIPPLSIQQHPLVPVATVKHLHLPSIVSLVPYTVEPSPIFKPLSVLLLAMDTSAVYDNLISTVEIFENNDFCEELFS
jgi:hypothetical protein